jgi:predicted ATPase/DNA-binding XRE family transcriptional regulator
MVEGAQPMMTPPEEAGARPVLSAFGHHVKRLRIATDLTQEELAERSGLSARLISDLERGSMHRPRRSTLEMLADGLGLDGWKREHFHRLARGQSIADSPEENRDAEPPRLLPAAPDSLIGREGDIESIAAMLIERQIRLVTLVGPGGIGKTRLAIAVAESVRRAYPGGAVFIDLAPIRTPSLVVPAIATGMGLAVAGEAPAFDILARALAGRSLLLVLDNLEQVLAAANDIAALLARCGDLTILATSRAVLHIRGEQVCPVEPLEVPRDSDCIDLACLARIPAVTLFLDRAVKANPAFRLTPANAADVATIVRRLDGLPLAIELAAARMNVLTAAGLRERLGSSLALLSGGARDLPSRLQTLNAAIDWSYDLLEPSQQRLFRRLAIFAGGFTLAAAEAVTGAPDDSSVSAVDDLTALVDNSLVQPLQMDQRSGVERRFRMLETIRECAHQRLVDAGELDAVATRHAAWFLRFADHADRQLAGRHQATWIEHMTLEHDNVRAALDWAVGREDARVATCLAGAYANFWALHGDLQEGRTRLETVLGLDGAVPPAARARALIGLGVIATEQGDFGRVTALEEALAIAEAEGDAAAMAMALRQLGNATRAQGHHLHADRLQERAIEQSRSLGDQVQVCATLRNLGLGAYDQGDFERARRILDEALAIGIAIGESINVGAICTNLATIAIAQEDYDGAATLQMQALERWRSVDFDGGISSICENLGIVALARGRAAQAAQLLAAGDASRRRFGAPGRLVDRGMVRAVVDTTRIALGDATFTEAWESGRSMAKDDAIVLASQIAERRGVS